MCCAGSMVFASEVVWVGALYLMDRFGGRIVLVVLLLVNLVVQVTYFACFVLIGCFVIASGVFLAVVCLIGCIWIWLLCI